MVDSPPVNNVYLVRNDILPILKFAVVDEQTKAVIDLTGAVPRFKFKRFGGSTQINGGHDTCTITSAVDGMCQYAFVALDMQYSGDFFGELEVTFPTSKIETARQFVYITIRDDV